MEDSSVNLSVEESLKAKEKQVMAMAAAPLKNVLSTAFMLWMSGSSIQIFSIMMTGMALINPIKAIFGTNNAFKEYEKEEGIDLRVPKLTYVGIQLLALGVALYKCSTMGLLPLTSADWIEYLPKVEFIETSLRPFYGAARPVIV